MSVITTTPYFIRAIHEWCCDNGMTPYLVVAVSAQTRVPVEYVKDGEITLNISPTATQGLQIGNEVITFSARFNGASRQIYVPVNRVRAVFAREDGTGMAFEVNDDGQPEPPPTDEGPGDEAQPEPEKTERPRLKVVK